MRYLKNILFAVSFIVALVSVLLLIRFNRENADVSKVLDQEKYYRLKAEEDLQRSEYRIKKLEADLQNTQVKVSRVQENLDREKNANSRLKSQLEQLGETQAGLKKDLEQALMRRPELTESALESGASVTADQGVPAGRESELPAAEQ